MVISSFVCVQFCISMLQKSAFWYQSSTEIAGICMTESLSWFWRSQVTCVWLVMLVNVYTPVFSLLWMWLFFNTSLIVRVTWWVQCENLWDQWERWAAGEILSLTVWASPVAFGTVLSSCLMQDLSCTFLLFPSSVQKWGGKKGDFSGVVQRMRWGTCMYERRRFQPSPIQMLTAIDHYSIRTAAWWQPLLFHTLFFLAVVIVL